MLTLDVADTAKKISGDEESEVFFNFVNSLNSLADRIPQILCSFDQNAKRDLINKINNLTSSNNIWSLYTSAEAYRKALMVISEENIDHWPETIDIASKIKAFLSSYESFLKNRGVDSIVQLLWGAHVLSANLLGFRSAAKFFENSIAPSNLGQENNILVVRLECEIDFRVVEKSLRACEKIYEIICQITDVSKEDFPLELVKLETGSFMAILRGARQVILVFKTFLEGYAQYAMISRRIADTQVSSKSIESQLALVSALEAHGLSTEDIKLELVEAAEKLAKQTSNLIGTAESVGINGTFFSLRNDSMKLLTQEQKLLGHDEIKRE